MISTCANTHHTQTSTLDQYYIQSSTRDPTQTITTKQSGCLCCFKAAIPTLVQNKYKDLVLILVCQLYPCGCDGALLPTCSIGAGGEGVTAACEPATQRVGAGKKTAGCAGKTYLGQPILVLFFLRITSNRGMRGSDSITVETVK